MDNNISDFPGKENISPKKWMRQQRIKRLKTRIYTILIVLFLILAVVIAYFTYERTKVYSNLECVNSVAFSTSESASITEFAGSILSYSKDGAQSTDSEGNLLWNQTFDMQNPMSSICGNTVAFADYGGSVIYVQTKDAEGYEINTDMPIRKITVSDKGIVAAILEDVNVTWIYLYDSNGEQIACFRTTMENSGYPVDFDISPSGELVGVSYYYLDIGDVKSSVAFYNFGDVGQNNIDNYVSGYNYKDSLVPIVRFLSNSNVFALSSERLTIYKGAQKPVSNQEIFLSEDVLSVFYDEPYIGVVFRNNDGDSEYRLVVYSADGEKLSEKEFDFDYSAVVFGNGQYALYGNTDVCISTVNGKVKFEKQYGKSVRLMIPTASPTKYVIVTDSSIDTVQMK